MNLFDRDLVFFQDFIQIFPTRPIKQINADSDFCSADCLEIDPFLQKALVALNVGVVVADAGGRITFLNQVVGLSLSLEQIAALEARTEGWIAVCTAL